MNLDELRKRDAVLRADIARLETMIENRKPLKALRKELSALKRERKSLDAQIVAAFRAEAEQDGAVMDGGAE